MAQPVEHIVHIMGGEREAVPRWGICRKAKATRTSQPKQAVRPRQGSNAPIEAADVGSSPTVTTCLRGLYEKLPVFFFSAFRCASLERKHDIIGGGITDSSCFLVTPAGGNIVLIGKQKHFAAAQGF